MAVRVLFASITTVHWVPVTDVQPVQLPKVEPTAAVALITAVVPELSEPLQEPPLQVTPAVGLESEPLPVPTLVAVRVLLLVVAGVITSRVIELAEKVALNPPSATGRSARRAIAKGCVVL